MNVQEATQYALGYAAGREDASGIPTAASGEGPGFMAFAEAFARGWDEYNTERRFMMVNCRDAYETWQLSDGQAIDRFAKPVRV